MKHYDPEAELRKKALDLAREMFSEKQMNKAAIWAIEVLELDLNKEEMTRFKEAFRKRVEEE